MVHRSVRAFARRAVGWSVSNAHCAIAERDATDAIMTSIGSLLVLRKTRNRPASHAEGDGMHRQDQVRG